MVQTNAKTTANRRSGSMFNDPVVKVMTWAVVLIVIGALLAVISLLYFGYLDRGEGAAPRTFGERQLAQTESMREAGVEEASLWRQNVALLIQQRQFARAQAVIDEGKGVIDDEWGQELLVAQAELYAAQEKYDLAIETANEAQAKIMEVYETELASPTLPNRAKSWGVSPTHGELSLLKGQIYTAQGKTVEAQAELQAYSDSNPMDASILIDLGNLKFENGDTEGAKADFQKAAQFLPDDPEVLEGLEKTGAN